jgi:hypothetical protein
MISTEKFTQNHQARIGSEIKISILELDVLKLIAEDKNGDEIATLFTKALAPRRP